MVIQNSRYGMRAITKSLTCAAGAREEALLDEAAGAVRGGDVDLLNELRRIRWCTQAQIARRAHLSAPPAG